MLKSPTMIVYLSILLVLSVFAFIYFEIVIKVHTNLELFYLPSN